MILVAPEGGDPAPGPIETTMARQGLGEVRPVELVLLHKAKQPLYLGTSAWLAPRRLARHHHVTDGDDAELARLVRSLTGRATGLVLGGGGARSFAQIGVLRALEEAGVEIDLVGGTSMGAFLGAQVAMGWNARKMLQYNEVTWTKTKPLKDYTFPYMGLVTGRRFFAVARATYGDAQFEDLRIPFFCCSSNLTKASVMVHSAGPLWRALGASIAVPGLAPPAFENGELLADGAVLDNLPVDVMRARCDGHVIAVDVSPEEDLAVDKSLTMAPSSWSLLYKTLVGRRTGLPTIFELLMRSAGLGSVQQVETMKRLSDWFFHPPIEDYSIFDFGKIRVLEEAGYTHAKKFLAEEGRRPTPRLVSGLAPVPAHRPAEPSPA